MRLFETIKETITVGQTADYYGMKIGRNNMICCLFHNDRHPSMKLNPTYYYCFGCCATGDIIQFVVNLFELSNYEAAWFDGSNINETAFCNEFLHTHKIIFANNAFLTPKGRITENLQRLVNRIPP